MTVIRPLRFALALACIVACGGTVHAESTKGRGCDLPNADRAVHGITLGDPRSAEAVLGKDLKTAIDDRDSDFAWVVVATRDGRQVLRLRHHAGDVAQSYLEAEVKAGPHPDAPMRLAATEFVSGKGARLGMRRAEIVGLFGSCFKATKREGGGEILRYEVADDSSNPASPILRQSGMPQYYADYEFRAGRLVRFRFGHDPV